MMEIVNSAAIGIIGGADGPTAIFVSTNGVTLQLLSVAAALAIGYLLGSLMFGIIVSKGLFHDDVRSHGSGNAGSTNILRTYGKGAAALALAGDMGKGVLAVFLARWVACLMWGLPLSMAGTAFGPEGFNVGAAAAFAALLGHMKPLFFGFKGGKGVAVAAGTILAAAPRVFLGLLVVFIVVVAVSRIVSLTSITCAVCYPIFTLADCLLAHSSHTMFNTLCALVMAVIVIWLHRANIQRLKDGTEYKFGSKKK